MAATILGGKPAKGLFRPPREPIAPSSIRRVHLRRALLLFAIVLGLAAVAASFSRSGDEAPQSPPPAAPAREEPTVSPGPSAERPAALRFNAARDRTRRLEVGRPATVEVAVDEPGQVQIPLLGLSSPAAPVTPARFDILPSEARRYRIVFTRAAGDEQVPAGTLDVTPADG
jgi:hypothetical protein